MGSDIKKFDQVLGDILTRHRKDVLGDISLASAISGVDEEFILRAEKEPSRVPLCELSKLVRSYKFSNELIAKFLINTRA